MQEAMLKARKLNDVDPEVYAAIRAELKREQRVLVMIASENYASPAVIKAQANIMTNKYAEGYPGARYYGGCESVDRVELLAVDRLKRLFGAEYANVQPHSGSQANMAAYIALLNPGDTIMGMDLSHGGHLTHGSSVNFSGKWFKPVFYGLDPKTQVIDYGNVKRTAREFRPGIIVAGASAYPRRIDFAKFADIASECGALLMADMAHIAGLVAARLHPSPVGKAHVVTSTTHKTLRGPRGGFILCSEEWGERIDKAVFPGTQGGPLMHVIAAKAVAFGEALDPSFAEYQKQVLLNAKALAEGLLARGLTLVSGGTDNHLILMDLTDSGITGLEGERILAKAGIVANKNSVPFDPLGPRVTSGLRLGTPALTTRGMKEAEMGQIARLVADLLQHREDDKILKRSRGVVLELCDSFPIYDQF